MFTRTSEITFGERNGRKTARIELRHARLEGSGLTQQMALSSLSAILETVIEDAGDALLNVSDAIENFGS